MASTNIAAAVIRTITTDYLTAEVPSASKLLASGAVTVDSNPPFFSANVPGSGLPSANGSGGGATVVIPENLEFTTADAAIADDDNDEALNSLATSSDTGVVVRRTGNMAVKDSAVVASAEDFNAEALGQAPGYWAKRIDITLYNVLSGAFATALNSASHRLDPGTPFQRSAIPNIMKAAAVRDQWPLYSIWLMNGIQFADAFNDGIVQYVNAGQFGERLLMTGDVPTIAGKQVIVDDNIPETDGTTYLLKPGSLYLGFQSNLTVETARFAAKGGGLWAHFIRQHYVPHLRRVVYAGAANPTNSTLATGASWTASNALTANAKLMGAFKIRFENA
jgi:hypothetical protein